ncbi:MAG: hypothetical protein H6710_06265 [Myxococcales bacterium]|nr:hypothetical protein [Myxococcales bacterium]
MAHEGLNVDDPGIRLLADAVAEVPPSALALVCSGPLPGVGPGATRLVSDVRERPEAGERCVPFSFAVDEGRGASFDAAVVWPRPTSARTSPSRASPAARSSCDPAAASSAPPARTRAAARWRR